MRRTNAIGLSTGGAALSLLLGSGLFAASSDTAKSEGNIAQSGTYVPAGAHDVQVARVPMQNQPDPVSFNGCASATYGDGPLSALVYPASVVLGYTGNFDGQHDVLCVKNAGTSNGRIRVVFDNVVQTEMNACATTEASAGDTTCANGEAGELAAVVEPEFYPWGGATGSCSGLQTAFAGWEGAGQVLGASVAPGQTCVWQLRTHTAATATENELLKAQTDRVQWDITFVLEDIPA